jgi:hypothetical protein
LSFRGQPVAASAVGLARTLGGTIHQPASRQRRWHHMTRHRMLVVLLGSHVAAALVGVGMSVLVFTCAKVASRMNARAASASRGAAIAWHVSRLLFSLVCAALLSFPWLYLLLELRIPLSVFVSLLVGLAASAYLFIKLQVFGQATWIHS